MDILNILDTVKLPFELPLLIHPITVHFAIALPVIVLLLEIANLFAKRKCIGVINSLLLTLMVIVYFAAFFAGKTDGSEAYSLLSSDGQKELKTHKLLGMYLVYASVALLILKLITAMFTSRLAKLFFIVILAIFLGFVFKQGKDGGELVYEYGANVKAVSDMDDKIMNLEDELDSCKSELETCKKTEQTTPQPAPQPTTQEQPTTPVEKQTPQSQPEEKNIEDKKSEEVNVTVGKSIEEKAKTALEEMKAAVKTKVEETNITTEHQ